MPSYSELATRLVNFECRDLGTGVSDNEIAAAERSLELRIEGGYRQFLKQFGWGGVEHLELYGLGGPPHLDLLQVTESERSEMEPPLSPHLLPVMNDGGGNLFCLDTKAANDPPIVFWDHTGGADQAAEIEGESFSSWLWAQLNGLD